MCIYCLTRQCWIAWLIPAFQIELTSWSPDGAHITASNAMNNKGLVSTAAVITLRSWTSDISLVGHENLVEAALHSES